MTAAIIGIIVSYLLGAAVGSLVLGWFRGFDIREHGSGNAGGTNALRTQGRGFAAAVMVIDVGKGVLAAWPVAGYAAAVGGAPPGLVAVLCGAAAVVGHVWPVFFGFRGGKGAATLVGVVGTLAPAALLVVLATFGVVLVLSGFVGLATILATSSMIVWSAIALDGGLLTPFGAFAAAMTVFILYTHRSNIARMRAGSENRFHKVMLFRARR
ncbi:MAG: glycerol-3-phosphate acyltransferase [Gammaproteobacteria bacterium]